MQDDTQLLETAISQRSEQLVTALKQRGLTMTTVESCTGGMIAAAVTSVAGSSAVFHQGYVTYCDAAKHALVGVRRRTLRRYTAVSAQTASEMAKGGARRAKAELCISVTGYAGPPSGDPDEEVGLVYIGCRFDRETKVRRFRFAGDRGEVRLAACAAALGMALRALEG